MSNNNSNVDIAETSPSHGTSTVTSSAKSQQQRRQASNFASPKVSHIQDEAGVTYRVVQIPSDFLQQAVQQVAVPAAQLIGTAQNQHNSDMVGSSGQQQQQQIFLNTSPDATKIAYIPTSSGVTLSNSSSALGATTQLQLQAVEGNGGQYYIMIPPAELVQTSGGGGNGSSSGQGRMGNTSAMPTATATPRIQQAAFIPLSKLDGTASALVTTTASQQITFGPPFQLDNPPKEIKRRVSHNEVEKRRRDKINSWINKLARLVPCAVDDASKQGQVSDKMFSEHSFSKGGILAKTVDYINELRQTNVRLAEQLHQMEEDQQHDGSGIGVGNIGGGGVRQLRQQMAELSKENKLLKQKLLENGISLPQQQQQQQMQMQMSNNTIVVTSTGSFQQQHQLQTSSPSVGGGFSQFAKRLIPVTVTPTGAVVLMSTTPTSSADVSALLRRQQQMSTNNNVDSVDDDDEEDLDQDDLDTDDRMDS